MCTALEISRFSSWIQESPGKVSWRRFRSSARIAASCRKKGSTSRMRPALGSHLDQGASEETLADPDVPG